MHNLAAWHQRCSEGHRSTCQS